MYRGLSISKSQRNSLSIPCRHRGIVGKELGSHCIKAALWCLGTAGLRLPFLDPPIEYHEHHSLMSIWLPVDNTKASTATVYGAMAFKVYLQGQKYSCSTMFIRALITIAKNMEALKLSIIKRMAKASVIYTNNEILLNRTKPQTPIICSKIGWNWKIPY